MSYQIPDPRWEMPELLEPRRKPVGNVVIDWTHPLTRDLKHFVNYNSNQRADLVDGSFPTGFIGTHEISHGALIGDGASGNYRSKSRLNQNGTIMVVAYPDAVSDTGRIFNQSDVNAPNSIAFLGLIFDNETIRYQGRLKTGNGGFMSIIGSSYNAKEVKSIDLPFGG